MKNEFKSFIVHTCDIGQSKIQNTSYVFFYILMDKNILLNPIYWSISKILYKWIISSFHVFLSL